MEVFKRFKKAIGLTAIGALLVSQTIPFSDSKCAEKDNTVKSYAISNESDETSYLNDESGLADTTPCLSSKNGEKRYIVKLKNQSLRKNFEKKHNEDIVVSHEKDDQTYLKDSNVLDLSIDSKEKNELEKESDIIIEPNYVVHGSVNNIKPVPITKEEYDKKSEREYSDDPTKFIPSDDFGKDCKECTPWNINTVASGVTIEKNNAKGVRIAIIDSGIDVHDDLNTKGWIDFSDTVSGYKPVDNCGHGTEVAGVMAARLNNNGLVGLAQGAQIFSVKVLDSKNQSTVSNVIKALNWCIQNKIDVINMSFGMDNYSEILEETINTVAKNNIVMVAAAGNENSVQYPAKYENVIAVGSVNDNQKVSEFSPKGGDINVYAPGEEINTTGFVGTYVKNRGTSYAAPHVSAVAAILKRKYSKLGANDISNIICNSGMTIENEKAGIVNLYSAIKYAKKYGDEKKNKTSSSKHFYKNENIKINDKENKFDEKDLVEGSWCGDSWEETFGSDGSGHLLMINTLHHTNFSEGTSDYNEHVRYRWICAYAAQKIDASKYNSNWSNILKEKNYEFSPYHGNTHYTYSLLHSVENFLYELSRRRLVLRSNLDLNYNNYNNKDEYKGVYVPNSLKNQ